MSSASKTFRPFGRPAARRSEGRGLASERSCPRSGSERKSEKRIFLINQITILLVVFLGITGTGACPDRRRARTQTRISASQSEARTLTVRRRDQPEKANMAHRVPAHVTPRPRGDPSPWKMEFVLSNLKRCHFILKVG